MIPAASSCPSCLKTSLALDPQPYRVHRGNRPHADSRTAFACLDCNAAWSCENYDAGLHYRFLVARGFLRPDGTLSSPHVLAEPSPAARAAPLPLWDDPGSRQQRRDLLALPEQAHPAAARQRGRARRHGARAR